MLPGHHYSWECGRQPSIGPTLVDGYGWLERKSATKVVGFGDAFFYYQMLVGDTVDNIAGVPGIGIVTAFNLLVADGNVSSSTDAYDVVVEQYKKAHGDDWEKHFDEMSKLLWMVRELDKEGNPIFYCPPSKMDTV